MHFLQKLCPWIIFLTKLEFLFGNGELKSTNAGSNVGVTNCRNANWTFKTAHQRLNLEKKGFKEFMKPSKKKRKKKIRG